MLRLKGFLAVFLSGVMLFSFGMTAHAEVWATRLPIDSNRFENGKNTYKDLKVPTEITKIGDTYFVVDCYHDRVVYSKDLTKPLDEWRVMCSQAVQPHTIASDGVVYLVDDTENHRELVFEWANGRFQNTQVMNGIGYRPHCTVYDAETASFYVWSSMTGEMYIMKRDPATNGVYLSDVRKLDELYGLYVRSFTIVGDQIIFPAGRNGYTMAVDKNTFQVLGRYPVPIDMSGMAQIIPIDGMLYITISTDLDFNQNVATLIRTPSLAALSAGVYEDVYGAFHTEGTPYYITYFDGAYYLANHRSKKGIFRFSVNQGALSATALF